GPQRPQLVVEVYVRTDGLAEHAEVERLVRSVRGGARVHHPVEDQREVPVAATEERDEGDRPADADLDQPLPPGAAVGPLGGLERGAGRLVEPALAVPALLLHRDAYP